jgi:hypothetical protein
VKTVMRCLLVIVLLLLGSRAVAAQSITFTNGNGGTFTIASAVAGQDPTAVSNGAGNFSTTTKSNQGILRIRAQLDQPMPPNTTLTLTLTYPLGTNQGAKVLGITPVDMVVNITPPNGNTTTPGTVTYSFSATASAGVIPPFSRTVTLTIGP